MKKVLLLLIFAMLLTSCAKKQTTNVAVDEIMEKIKTEAKFTDAAEDDVKKLEIAERYGISTDDIEDGIVYYTKAAETVDKIMLIKGKDYDTTARIERAVGNELIRLNDTWSKDEKQYTKVRKHVLKTHGNYVILIVADNYKEIEKVFDDVLF